MFSRSKKPNVEALIQAGYRYACALQADMGEAQGLVHEAWIRASKVHGEVPDKALLFRCVRNLFIDHYRRTRSVSFTSLDAKGFSTDELMGAMDVTELPDAQLQRALLQLREAEREVLFLSVVEGYTANEIATLTDKPRGTVLSLIHRARIRLKTLMVETNVTPFNREQGEH